MILENTVYIHSYWRVSAAGLVTQRLGRLTSWSNIPFRITTTTTFIYTSRCSRLGHIHPTIRHPFCRINTINRIEKIGANIRAEGLTYHCFEKLLERFETLSILSLLFHFSSLEEEMKNEN